jgi:hypothetical protein
MRYWNMVSLEGTLIWSDSLEVCSAECIIEQMIVCSSVIFFVGKDVVQWAHRYFIWVIRRLVILYTILYILFASILLRMFRMKMTTIYPSTATARPTTTTTTATATTIAPAYAATYATTIAPAYATPILAIPQNQVLFGSIFQKINSNGPCSSCGNSK